VFIIVGVLTMEQIQARMGRVSLFAIFMRPTEPAPIVDASGMYIVAVDTREAAEAIAAGEPFEQAGWRTHS
jgi:hypothetical protein